MLKDERHIFNEFGTIEELLGAYIEGNLTSVESAHMEKLLGERKDIADLIYEVENTPIDTYDSLNQIENFEEFSLPCLDASSSDDFDLPNNMQYSQYIDTINMKDEDYDDLLGMKIFGEPGSNSGECNPLIKQYYPDTCAIRSQQIVLRDYGIDISQEQMIQIATENGWYEAGGGTPMYRVGEFYNLAGIPYHQSANNTVFDLANELSQGHRVIVGVDSGELWYKGSIPEKLEDISGNERADHALIVAGVEVNPNNPHDVKIVLTDPGSGDLRIEYTMDEFVDAWKDSNCFMVTTDEPAPYQFDPVTNREVPSGFYSEYCHNNFIIDNGYELSPDNFTIPDDYMASYSESSPIIFDIEEINDLDDDFNIDMNV